MAGGVGIWSKSPHSSQQIHGDPQRAAARQRTPRVAEALRLIGPKGIEALDRMLDDRDVYARHQAVLMLQESGELDRQVDVLGRPVGPEREAAESLVRRFVRVGQVGRLRELQETHPDSRVREALAALLGIAATPGGGAQ